MPLITGDYVPNPSITETDDLPNDLTTTVSLIPTQTLNGTIDAAIGDRGDYVSVEMDAGIDYVIRMDGAGLRDPYLFLIDSAGNELRSNDDWNGLNSQIAFTPTETGTYFLRATFFGYWNPNNQANGGYRLSVSRDNGQHLIGTGLEDTIIGNADRDTIEGFAGDDSIDGNGGGDRIFSGSGNDTITNAGVNAQLSTGDGNDSVEGDMGARIWTGAGADTVIVDDRNAVVHTGDDADMVTVVRGDTNAYGTRVYTWFGDDTVNVEGTATVYGGPGNDLIQATGPEARLVAYGDTGGPDYSDHGNDTIIGGTDDDWIYGGYGNDSLVGNGGADQIEGGTGNDTVDGGEGRDRIFGGQGDDSLNGVYGNDELWGGDGNDTAHGGEGNDELGGGQTGDDLLFGNQGDDIIWGGAGNDTLRGGYGNDSLHGGTGNDQLRGDDGNDWLDGGSGSNVLDGGGGNDTVIARSETDTIVFSEGHDLLLAFAPGGGARIDLSGVAAITDFADLQANHLSETDQGAVIDDGLGNTLTLNLLLAADLGADDFLF